MAKTQFTHLHAHTHYSLLDGLGKIDGVVDQAKKLGMDSCAITDHGVMYGVIEFYQKATEAGIKPIIGEEVYVAPHSRLQKRAGIDNNPFHLILLAKNEVGYKNLIQLTTQAHLDGFYYKPRTDHELLAQYSEGLIALTACMGGQIPDAIMNKTDKEVNELVEIYQKIFGENLFFEVQPHRNNHQQEKINQALFRLGKERGIGLAATGDFHYVTPEEQDVHDILLCIQTNKTVNDEDRMDLKEFDLSMLSPEAMQETFSDHPEAVSNTAEIAKQCNLELQFGKTKLPYFDVPKKKDPDLYLREQCIRGLSERYGVSKPAKEDTIPTDCPQNVRERLETELTAIQQTGFATYLLIVQDFVLYAKSQKIMVGPGRGSAAGSLVCYLLGITNVDPLKYGLLFERFINLERVEYPDIDMDFADTRRDEVLKYVEEKYGKDHVAQVITFGTMAARAAIRDAARALGLPYAYADKIAKLIPTFTDLAEALETVPELKALYENDVDAKRVLNAAKVLEGVCRHASTHACAVVISKEPLTAYLPVQYDANNKGLVTQYSMVPVSDLGLLKMDFLGLSNLTIIETALKIIEKTRGEKINIDTIPLDDVASYQLFHQGRTTGVFQFESQGMKRNLQLLKPTVIEDLIAMVALYRPGPMANIPDFIAAKNGQKEVTYIHPKLEPLLKDTYGIAVYQEQLMKIAQSLAGFSLGEADVLRKAVAKKKKGLLEEQKEKFLKSCVANGISNEVAHAVFAFIEPFAGYGFNKSHAACYALVGYQTAYLKAHYPAEFMTALLTSDEGNLDRVAIEVEESRQMGLAVLPPDINESFTHFTVVADPTDPKKQAIRFGLGAIKNVGLPAVELIIEERKENGPYKNLSDLLHRVTGKELNKKSLESLVKAGAMDRFADRRTMLNAMDQILQYAKGIQQSKASGQTSLFGLAGTEKMQDITLPAATPATQQEKLGWERDLLGLYITAHPLSDFRGFIERYASYCHTLPTQNGMPVRICGVVNKIQRIITRKQQTMLFVTVEDFTGSCEVLVFPKTLEARPDLWVEEAILVIDGKISDKDGVPKILTDTATKITIETTNEVAAALKPLGTTPVVRRWPRRENTDTTEGGAQSTGNTTTTPTTPSYEQVAAPRIVNRLEINLSQSQSPEKLAQLKNLLTQSPAGSCDIYLRIPQPATAPRVIKTNFKIEPSPHMKNAIEQIVGPGMVEF